MIRVPESRFKRRLIVVHLNSIVVRAESIAERSDEARSDDIPPTEAHGTLIRRAKIYLSPGEN